MEIFPECAFHLVLDAESRSVAEAGGFCSPVRKLMAQRGRSPSNAREGADHPLQPVGYTDALEKHAVGRQAIGQIDAGASGAVVRKALAGPPFGWPRGAVDEVLIALHRSRHLSATLSGTAVSSAGFDQYCIAKAALRVERAVLSVENRLALRQKKALIKAVDDSPGLVG